MVKDKDLSNDAAHISNQFAKLVKTWKVTNPEAIRQLKKFNDSHNNCLVTRTPAPAPAHEDAAIGIFCCSNGEKLDLSKIKQECLNQKPAVKKKK